MSRQTLPRPCPGVSPTRSVAALRPCFPHPRRHPAMSSQHAPAQDAAQRGEEILAVFDTAFGELLAADPAAFRVKFRKMAASGFAFYRGTACLFYKDLEDGKDSGPFL